MPAIRVMTFNVRGDHHPDGVNAWEQRADLNVRTIRKYAPDVIGFQECQQGNIALYREQLPEYAYMPGNQTAPDDPEHNPIFWRKERLQLLEAGEFWLNEALERHTVGWDAHFGRTAHWTRLRLLDNERDFLLLNTHLDHEGETARHESSKLILRQLDSHADLPLIVIGDFNCTPGTLAYDAFLQAGFTDTFLAAGNQDGNHSSTFHAFGGTKPSSTGKKPEALLEKSWRIDWILFKDRQDQLSLSACTIIRDAEPPLYPSDHYPVLAELHYAE
ncbi:MAG: endonuclease/exonuclease/phosphatase family protein [Ktedonobacteraceae bacterium]|nr:endonuclease/exonuclease/phosphatase family protein [Ktedonobacteraceae bacterium]